MIYSKEALDFFLFLFYFYLKQSCINFYVIIFVLSALTDSLIVLITPPSPFFLT